jgi:hypothetical protein
MRKGNDPPKPEWPDKTPIRPGDRLMTLDCGPGTVDSITPARETSETYAGMQFTPVLYHIKIDRDGSIVQRSIQMLARVVPEPTPVEPPAPQAVVPRSEATTEAVIALHRRFLGEINAGVVPDPEAVQTNFQKALVALAPEDLAVVNETVRAYEMVQIHLRKLVTSEQE